MTPDVHDQIMSTEEAAHFLGYGERTIRDLVDDRKIPYIHLKGKYKFLRSSLIVWMKSREIEPKDSGLESA